VSTVLGTAAMLDSVGRFTSNVGVPAAIALFVLWQIGPKLDAVALEQRQTNTELTVIGASCLSGPRAQQVVP
jgi:hypothetical protein